MGIFFIEDNFQFIRYSGTIRKPTPGNVQRAYSWGKLTYETGFAKYKITKNKILVKHLKTIQVSETCVLNVTRVTICVIY